MSIPNWPVPAWPNKLLLHFLLGCVKAMLDIEFEEKLLTSNFFCSTVRIRLNTNGEDLYAHTSHAVNQANKLKRENCMGKAVTTCVYFLFSCLCYLKKDAALLDQTCGRTSLQQVCNRHVCLDINK